MFCCFMSEIGYLFIVKFLFLELYYILQMNAMAEATTSLPGYTSIATWLLL